MGRKLDVSRREFLKRTSATAALVAGSDILSLSMLRPTSAAVNPLEHYPNRVTLGWTPLALDATVQANVRH